MSKMPFMMFYPQDWLYDTRILTPEERALWIDLLCFMWNSSSRGVIEATRQNVAQMVGLECSKFNYLIDSIKNKKVAEVTDGNEKVTIISRRMVREEKERESSRIRKRRYDARHSNGTVTDKKSYTKKSYNKKDLLIPEDLKEEEADIKDWLRYKEERGQPYKTTGLNAFWNKVRKIPKEKRHDSFQNSMASNWAGLFESNGKQKEDSDSWFHKKIAQTKAPELQNS
jgi:hypothetical protein